MSALTSTILWISLQIALFSMVGSVAVVLLRRRGPNAAATGATAILAVTLVLSLLAFSPWPRWSVHLPGAATGSEIVHRAAVAPLSSVEAAAVPNSLAQATDDMPHGSQLGGIWQQGIDWIQTVGQGASENVATRPAWHTWLPIVLIVGMGLCLVRLVAGIWAAWNYRLQSQRIEDAALLDQVDGLRAELGSPSIEVRQTALLNSAATVGWWRPLLLLPADWFTWTETERRVVLAHELAHIARRDYLTGLVARLVAAIHFYQPLVLWLGRQLRIQQELAADSRAADVAGDRQVYLFTLAQMALRADEKPLPWAARAFLPGTSLLIKRVSWLKRQGQRVEESLSRKGKWVLAGMIAAAAIGVAGIRGPSELNSRSSLAAAPEEENDKPQAKPADRHDGAPTGTLVIDDTKIHLLQYVPDDAKLVVAVRPNELVNIPIVEKLLAHAERGGLEKELGLSLGKIELIAVVENSPSSPIARIVVRAAEAHDWKELIDRRKDAKPIQLDGKTCYMWNAPPEFGKCIYIPDDRTLVIGTDDEIKKIIAGREQPIAQGEGQFLARVDMELVRDIIRRAGGPAKLGTAMFEPIVDKTKLAMFSATLKKESPDTTAKVNLALVCESAEAAKQVESTLNAALILAQNFMDSHSKELQRMAANAPEQMKQKMQIVSDACKMSIGALKSVKVEIQPGDTVVIASGKFAMPSDSLMAFFLPAMAASREAAMRTVSMNNMKQLALAMMASENARKRLLSSVVIGTDGKTPHSWRVEVLPLLGDPIGDAVYKDYHFDEPWDSDHNKELIKKLPAVFHDPHDDPNSTNASYFMLTGKGTLGGVEGGAKMSQISDGTSLTVLLVEAKRDIPWTKPEDIEVDPDPEKPLPAFGGHLPGSIFLEANADGSVQVLSGNMDSKTLRAMTTFAGGERIDVDAIHRGDATIKPPPGMPQPDRSWDKSSGAPDSIMKLRRGLSDHPDDPKLHNELSVEFAKISALTEAVQEAREALRLKPDYAEAHLNLGSALAKAGRDAEAIEHYQQALRLKPDSAEAHNALGLALVNIGRKEEAIVQLENALKMARAKGQTDLADEIEHELQAVRGASKPPAEPSNGKSSSSAPAVGLRVARVKIEFHRAENEPAEGLTEATVPGHKEKIYLHPEVELTNDDVADTSVGVNMGQPSVNVVLTDAGTKKMEAISKSNLKKPLAIVVDGKLLFAPTIQSVIKDKFQVTGGFTPEEAERIAAGIRGG